MGHASGTQVRAVGLAFCDTEPRSANCQEVKRKTTNNRMELAAAINGLKALRESCGVELVLRHKLRPPARSKTTVEAVMWAVLAPSSVVVTQSCRVQTNRMSRSR